MIISPNLTGTNSSPLAKSAQAGSNVKTPRSADNSTAQEALSILDSQTGGITASARSELPDHVAANDGVRSIIANILQQPAQAMLAQANLTPETVLRLLQE